LQRYIARRLLLLPPTLLLLAIFVFVLMRAMPGDVTVALAGGEYGSISPQEAERLKEELGLNKPIVVQFGIWLSGLPRGDLGTSLVKRVPVTEILLDKAEVTLSLALMAVVLSAVWAVPIGVASAVWRGGWFDQGTRVFTAGFMAVPNFWLGIIVILVLARMLDWSPPVQHARLFDDPWEWFQRLIFPAAVIGIRSGAVISRMTRSTMLDVINGDYVRTAHAKGLSPFTVIVHHALKNASLPIITMGTLLFAALLDGAVVIEQVFTLPGMGRQIIESVGARDFIMVQGMVFALGTLVMLWILVTDLFYAVLDPRIRYE